jgi:hypothetical protein
MDNLPNDIIVKIAIDLNIYDAMDLCSTSKKYKRLICDNENFWYQRLEKDFNWWNNNNNHPNLYDLTSKEIYIYLLTETKYFIDENNTDKLNGALVKTYARTYDINYPNHSYIVYDSNGLHFYNDKNAAIEYIDKLTFNMLLADMQDYAVDGIVFNWEELNNTPSMLSFVTDIRNKLKQIDEVGTVVIKYRTPDNLDLYILTKT